MKSTGSSATAEIARVVLVNHYLVTKDGQTKLQWQSGVQHVSETVNECDSKSLLKSIHCDLGAGL